ncbi:aminotransferase class V-fold PLP-dependent enzyme [Pseudoalteromonas sp. Hal099]
MQKAQKEFLDWQDLGVSVMEISHRSKDFLALTAKCEASLRRLMNISDEFEVLFMHGGGRGQFSAVPLNLHQNGKTAVYCENGVWSKVPLTKLINLLKPTQSTLEMTQTGCFL